MNAAACDYGEVGFCDQHPTVTVETIGHNGQTVERRAMCAEHADFTVSHFPQHYRKAPLTREAAAV
jgi:hypothetical protein